MTAASSSAILGIWGYSADAPQILHHDSGAAVVAGGKVLAAVNEERLTRRKNEGQWPARSINEALRLAGISLADVDRIAMGGLPPFQRAATMVTALLANWRANGIFLPNRWLYALLAAKKLRRRGPEDGAAPLVFVGHHEAHAAAAYYTAPFDDTAVVTIDGIGDSAWCGGVWRGRDGRLTRLRLFNGYASPGILYAYVTKAFGFRPARHEGKLTGLAGHGDSSLLIDAFRERLIYRDRQLFSRFIPQLFRNRVDADWPTTWIDELLDTHRREDIAAALQRHTEELATAIGRDALADTGCANLALAGGVVANVRVNQRLREVTPGGIWIHPNMGDGGLALGAALAVHGRQVAMDNVYLGNPIEDADAVLAGATDLSVWRPAPVAAVVARACAAGLIVGHAAGRMEYGPRALGHRTIFAAATEARINDTLNARLRRTEFMPFAPIMTEGAAPKYLIGWKPTDHAARFMTITYDVTEACRRAAPAVVHVDGTARPQVVSPRDGVVHEILVEYGRRAGHEIMINTSFNIHEEPIVGTASDALRSYRQGAVDVLVIEDAVLAKSEVMARLRE